MRMSIFGARARAGVLVAVGTAGAIGLSACGSDGGATKPAATVTVTASPARSQPATSATTTSGSGTSASTTDALSGEGGATPTSTGVLPASATGRPLTLSDFFQPTSDWQENRYDVAGKSQIQAIGTEVSSCGANSSNKNLELRLGNAFQTLSFTVGQADDSDAFDQNLTVEVIANNSQIDIQRVPFNQVKQFTEPVAGVNALQLRMYLDSQVQNCGRGSVIGVLSGATLS
jgi:hypothetical protein